MHSPTARAVEETTGRVQLDGPSLCKNHHWAMDQQLIAPTHQATWAVSKALIAKRSSGESLLAELSGQRLLRPRELAYCPSAAGIDFRLSALKAP